jgi:hypothetical protein
MENPEKEAMESDAITQIAQEICHEIVRTAQIDSEGEHLMAEFSMFLETGLRIVARHLDMLPNG